MLTDIYDGAYAGEDCLTVCETVDKVVFARADDGSSTPQVDEEAMKYLLANDFQAMKIECGRRIRVVEKEKGNQFVCSWNGQPETKLTKVFQEKEKGRSF